MRRRFKARQSAFGRSPEEGGATKSAVVAYFRALPPKERNRKFLM